MFILPSKRDLGTEPDIEARSVRLKVGRRPIVGSVSRLVEEGGTPLPDDLEIYIGYDLWLVTFTVNVMQEESIHSIRQVGFKVCFNTEPAVTIVEQLPQTKFVKILEGKLVSVANISVGGQASVAADEDGLLSALAGMGKSSIDIKASTDAGIAARVAFSIATPQVVAVGIGDDCGEWCFSRQDNPLVGNFRMTMVMLTPKYLDELKCKARVYATVSAFNMIPSKLTSDWVDLDVNLPQG